MKNSKLTKVVIGDYTAYSNNYTVTAVTTVEVLEPQEKAAPQTNDSVEVAP